MSDERPRRYSRHTSRQNNDTNDDNDTNNNSGRIVAGRGTHTRPFVLDESSGRTTNSGHAPHDDTSLSNHSTASYDRYLARRRAEAQATANHTSGTPATATALASDASRRGGTRAAARRSASDTSNDMATAYAQYQQHQQAAVGAAPSPPSKSPSGSTAPAPQQQQQQQQSQYRHHQRAGAAAAPLDASSVSSLRSHASSAGSSHHHTRHVPHKALETGSNDEAATSRDLRARRLALQHRNDSMVAIAKPKTAKVRATNPMLIRRSGSSEGSDDALGAASEHRRAYQRQKQQQQREGLSASCHVPRSNPRPASSKTDLLSARTSHGTGRASSSRQSITAQPQPHQPRRASSADLRRGDGTRPPSLEAHDAAVEKYLQRSRLAAAQKEAAPRRGFWNRGGTAAAKPAGRSSEAPAPTVLYDRDDPRGGSARTGGWSTKRHGTTAVTMTVGATAVHDRYTAGQSTTTDAAASGSQAGGRASSSSTVDAYLAQRNALKHRSQEVVRLGKSTVSPATALSSHNNTSSTPPDTPMLAESSESKATLSMAPASLSLEDSSSSSSNSETSDSELEVECASSVDHDDDDDDGDKKEWSVRVCVVSAVDFPASVVPNLPFSPFLKVGIVPLSSTAKGCVSADHPQGEATDHNDDTQAPDETRLDELTTRIHTDGLASIPKSRLRCTSAKILSKRDNGAVEFHEELRWDGVTSPHNVALALELSSRAVMVPANIQESPAPQTVGPFQLPPSPLHSSAGRATPAAAGGSGLGSLFRKITKTDSTEMEEANAAAAVAQHLVQDGGRANGSAGKASSKAGSKTNALVSAKKGSNQSELNVRLRRRTKKRRRKMTEELRLGSSVIPLHRLPLAKAMEGNQTARIEQWVELESSGSAKTLTVGSSPTASPATRNPSILLEISFSAPEVLDDSEDDVDEADTTANLKASHSKRASIKIRNQLKQEDPPEEKKIVEPTLEPGIIDFVCVVGARDIGDQKVDDGARGWVNSTPELTLLEQFPPNDEYHATNGRKAALPGKVEWFCFPEGCRLWRGLTPPNHDELNLKRFSASSSPNVSSSIASFDACLGCTTSFAWFCIASNSDEYGSESSKTYGAVIRFYVPAPTGIDTTQDDFGQLLDGSPGTEKKPRLWVPMGMCVTSRMPIVGVMEMVLLRLCEKLSTSGILTNEGSLPTHMVHQNLASLIINYQRPIPGVVNCSFSFLEGEQLHITLPPPNGLPAPPHGNAIASVCRLLGADGLNYLLAAFLSEQKILLHSDDVANLSLVAEVLTALLYPFQWSLPYVPVLPAEMMEFIEAPLSYLLGVPTCNMQHLDPAILEDIVVVDLDRDFSNADFFDGRRAGHKSKTPVPLPAAMASNIAKAVHKLIRAEEETDESYGTANFPGISFPRMEPESLPEREFRMSVAMEVCGLIRGFNDCLVFSSAQPVFNVDKFLQVAPAIFEDQRGLSAANGQSIAGRAISPRSRRFISILVCCQHFHQFLEMLESDALALFHVIMRSLQSRNARKDTSLAGQLLSLDSGKTVSTLCQKLQKVEDKIPTYNVKSYSDEWKDVVAKSTDDSSKSDKPKHSFPQDVLQQVSVERESQTNESGTEGVKSVSLEYLVELEKNPWRYQKMFQVSLSPKEDSAVLVPLVERVEIRQAIGDRRYRAWKNSSGFDRFDDETSIFSDDSKGTVNALDLASLLASVSEEMTQMSSASDDPSMDKDVSAVRRCLETAKLSGNPAMDTSSDSTVALVEKAEVALRNPKAQEFLLAVLNKRAQLFANISEVSAPGKRLSLHSGGSKLDWGMFEIFIRLAFAMLDSCDEASNFDSAYSLLKLSAGLYSTTSDPSHEVMVVYLTERMGLHPFYANLKLWENAKTELVSSRKELKNEDGARAGEEPSSEHDDEYEAVVATLYEMNGYGIPAEELARFGSLMCHQNGWFNSERGQTLLMLAKRVRLKRDQVQMASTPSKMSDMALMSPSPKKYSRQRTDIESSEEDFEWVEIGWCHPAAKSSRRAGVSESSRRSTAQNLLNKFEDKPPSLGTDTGKYMKRSAVTSLAYLGSSVVVTGGLDGGVFLARAAGSSADSKEMCSIRGVHLDWGSSGSRYSAGTASTSLDGEYGVGAVTCLASTRTTLNLRSSLTKDVVDPLEDEDILEAMESCRVVAGTTCGDLRVWSIKDVFSAVFYASKSNESGGSNSENRGYHRGYSDPSAYANSMKKRSTTDFAAGSSLTRLKFSLRGRALSGHRGGVSCIDVHSNVYRPDSIVSGGADGLIKLWSLRTPGSAGGRRSTTEPSSRRSVGSPADGSTAGSKAARSGDALSILSGHGGRIMCVKTAWHGDRLLSGGADRTVRLWDLAGSSGKCLNSLTGHFGLITSVDYWGPHTIISASTDRSIALWDARVRNTPLFSLRHHHAPVSSVLIGPRSDPVMVSAAIDGSVAAWDFRHLTGKKDVAPPPDAATQNGRKCIVARQPSSTLYTHNFSRSKHALGKIHLTKGTIRHRTTALCLGSDAVMREWDYKTGDVVREYATGHCDSISSFVSLAEDKVLGAQLECTGPEAATSTISASWDGTVRMRNRKLR